MKRLLALILMAAVLVSSAAATFVPDHEICENRNGRQLIVKTFTLAPTDNPDTLLEEPFEREGHIYSHVSIVKEEQPFEEKKMHSETVTVETSSKDLSAILEALDATIPYDDGEYSGILTLDHTSLKTEASGYSTKSYTVSDTKIYEGLDRNDPSYIPKTTAKNGTTLSLQSIEWAVQGTALSGDALVPTQYRAVARYSAGASSKVANGYVTTAVYSGELKSDGIASVVYTVTYVGEPIPRSLGAILKMPLILLIATGSILVLFAGVVIYILLRRNTRIYAWDEDGEEYEAVGRVRISPRNTTIDLRHFKMDSDEVVIEIEGRMARKLFGRLVRVRLRDGTASHRIEQSESESYWFTVSAQEEVTE